MARITREKFKTLKNVFDNFTERQVYKLISKGLIQGLDRPLAMGKEANVFTAKNDREETLIVKIYRLETCDFNKMYSYIRADERYATIKHRKRTVIFAWAQREYKNLIGARHGGVNVPLPMHQVHNVILMGSIGGDSPSPMLKDRPPKDPVSFLEELIRQVRKLYRCGLVHGDLSSFNIINKDDTPYLIDFSQATTLKSNQASELLERDIKNIGTYFKKIGIKSIDEAEILKSVKN